MGKICFRESSMLTISRGLILRIYPSREYQPMQKSIPAKSRPVKVEEPVEFQGLKYLKYMLNYVTHSDCCCRVLGYSLP